MSTGKCGVITGLVACSCWSRSVCSKAHRALQGWPLRADVKTHWVPGREPSTQQGHRRHLRLLRATTSFFFHATLPRACLGPHCQSFSCHSDLPAWTESIPGSLTALDPVSSLHAACSCWRNLLRHIFGGFEKIVPHSNSQSFDGSSLSFWKKVQPEPALQSPLSSAICNLPLSLPCELTLDSN